MARGTETMLFSDPVVLIEAVSVVEISDARIVPLDIPLTICVAPGMKAQPCPSPNIFPVDVGPDGLFRIFQFQTNEIVDLFENCRRSRYEVFVSDYGKTSDVVAIALENPMAADPVSYEAMEREVGPFGRVRHR